MFHGERDSEKSKHVWVLSQMLHWQWLTNIYNSTRSGRALALHNPEKLLAKYSTENPQIHHARQLYFPCFHNRICPLHYNLLWSYHAVICAVLKHSSHSKMFKCVPRKLDRESCNWMLRACFINSCLLGGSIGGLLLWRALVEINISAKKGAILLMFSHAYFYWALLWK